MKACKVAGETTSAILDNYVALGDGRKLRALAARWNRRRFLGSALASLAFLHAARALDARLSGCIEAAWDDEKQADKYIADFMRLRRSYAPAGVFRRDGASM